MLSGLSGPSERSGQSGGSARPGSLVRRGLRGARGASLLELLAGLALLALATAAASPSLARSWRDLRLREATVRVAAALRRGRVAALAAGRPWQVVVTASGEIRSEPVAGASAGGPAGGLTGGPTGGSTGSSTGSSARPEPLPATLERLPGGVRLAAATSGGSVRFSPLGTAENATFTLESQGGQRRVIVNQRGRITCE